MNDDVQFKIEIKERLTAIETLLKQMDFKAVEKTAEDALFLAQKNEKEIAELQSYVKWFVLAVIGAFISAICALVFK